MASSSSLSSSRAEVSMAGSLPITSMTSSSSAIIGSPRPTMPSIIGGSRTGGSTSITGGSRMGATKMVRSSILGIALGIITGANALKEFMDNKNGNLVEKTLSYWNEGVENLMTGIRGGDQDTVKTELASQLGGANGHLDPTTIVTDGTNLEPTTVPTTGHGAVHSTVQDLGGRDYQLQPSNQKVSEKQKRTSSTTTKESKHKKNAAEEMKDVKMLTKEQLQDIQNSPETAGMHVLYRKQEELSRKNGEDIFKELTEGITLPMAEIEYRPIGTGEEILLFDEHGNLDSQANKLVKDTENSKRTGLPFEKNFEFPGGFLVDRVMQHDYGKWGLYQGHVFGTTDYWDLCIIYVMKLPVQKPEPPKVGCKYLRPVVEGFLVENPHQDYPEEARYCVELATNYIVTFRGAKYAYGAWQFFERHPKFQPSFRPMERFESYNQPGVFYRFEKFLGRGTYGEAYLGLRETDGKPIVIKVLSANPKKPAAVDRETGQVIFDPPKQLLPGSTKSERDACNLSMELFAQISDKSKSRFVDCLENDGWITHSSKVRLLYSIWEYGGQSIEQAPPATLGDTLILMKSVFEAIMIMTRKGRMIHRDIKIPNIVWDRNKIVRLIDYSLSRRMHLEKDHGERCFYLQRYTRAKTVLEALNYSDENRWKKIGPNWPAIIPETQEFENLKELICQSERYSNAVEAKIEDLVISPQQEDQCKVKVKKPVSIPRDLPYIGTSKMPRIAKHRLNVDAENRSDDGEDDSEISSADESESEGDIYHQYPKDRVSYRWGIWCREYGYVVERFGDHFSFTRFASWSSNDNDIPNLPTMSVIMEENGSLRDRRIYGHDGQPTGELRPLEGSFGGIHLAVVHAVDVIGTPDDPDPTVEPKKDARKAEITCRFGIENWFSDWAHGEILVKMGVKNKGTTNNRVGMNDRVIMTKGNTANSHTAVSMLELGYRNEHSGTSVEAGKENFKGRGISMLETDGYANSNPSLRLGPDERKKTYNINLRHLNLSPLSFGMKTIGMKNLDSKDDIDDIPDPTRPTDLPLVFDHDTPPEIYANIKEYLVNLDTVQDEAKRKYAHCISWSAESAPTEVKTSMVEYLTSQPTSFDVHSLGVVMSHLLRDNFPESIEHPIYVFISRMITKMTMVDVRKRMTIDQGLQALSFVKTVYDAKPRPKSGRDLILAQMNNSSANNYAAR